MNASLHQRLIVIDALEFSNWSEARFAELAKGGLTAVHVTIAYWENARETLSAIGRWHRRFRRHRDILLPARRGADIERAKRDGKIAIILGAQNASPIEDDLSLVPVFHDAGLRIMQLTYNNQSLIGAGCYEKEDAGLSRFGRKVVAEMNRVGMIVDLSHSAERTSREAIDASARPVAITHANPSSFHESLRNKSDALLRALAGRGGMLGFSLYPYHLPGGAACTLEAFTAMIARTVELIGIDHVGIGSDACLGWGYETLEWMRSGRWTDEADFGEGNATARGWPAQPPWFTGPADMPNLTQGLAARGFAEREIAAVMGGNWLRLFTDGFAPA
jgi:membrane dipeptidase